MSYIVSGALATVKDAAGALHYRYQGARLPEGIDDEQLARLVSLGLIKKVEPETEEQAPSEENASGEAERPSDRASKAVWVDYAVEHGDMTREDADKLTRDQLAEKFAS